MAKKQRKYRNPANRPADHQKWFDSQPSIVRDLLLNFASSENVQGPNGQPVVRHLGLIPVMKGQLKLCSDILELRPDCELAKDLKAALSSFIASYDSTIEKHSGVKAKA